MEFTKTERLILANQFRILQHLLPEEADYYQQAVEILESGYAFEYGTLVQAFSQELTEDECKEVMEILDMHRLLRDAMARLEDQTDIDERTVAFRGFDVHHETQHMGYARFLIHEQGKWEEFRHVDLNSHYPALPFYRTMV